MLRYHLDISEKSYMRDYATDRSESSFRLQMTESGYFEAGPDYFTARDGKDAMLLLYTVSGCGQLDLERQHFQLGRDSAIIFGCREAHSYRTASVGEPWCFHWAHITLPSAEGFRALIADYPLILRGDDLVRISETFYRIDQLVNRSDIFADGYRSGCVADLLDIMLSAAEKEVGESLPKSAEIAKVIEYIDRHLAEPMNIDELAAICHISKYHFIRLFRRCTGLPPYQYLMAARINKSKILLTTTGLSVGEIAEEVGFLEGSHFSNVFKRLTGVMPSVYRREHYRL